MSEEKNIEERPEEMNGESPMVNEVLKNYKL
jgi:hypothetical protein